jgi:hypothetical protein
MNFTLFSHAGSVTLGAMAWAAMLITIHHGWVPTGAVIERPRASPHLGRPEARAVLEEFCTVCEGGPFTIC